MVRTWYDNSTLHFFRRYGLEGTLRRRSGLAAAAAFFWVVSSIPAPSQEAPLTGTVTKSGTVNAKISVSFVIAPPSGSTVSCGLALISNDALAPNDSKSVSAPVVNSAAVCSFPVNYKWTLSSSSSTMTIAYSVSGPFQDSSAINKVIPVPPSGSTTTVTAAVTQ